MAKILPHADVMRLHKEGAELYYVSGTATCDPRPAREIMAKTAEMMTEALREVMQAAVAHNLSVSDEPKVLLVERPSRCLYADYDEEGNGIGLALSMLPPELGVHVEFLGVKA